MTLRHRNRQGQSTLEFVLTMILLMGFVIFYTRFAFFLGYANLVQYATFMAARAYQAGGTTPDDQRERASAVIQKLLKKSEFSQAERFPIATADPPPGGGGFGPQGAVIGNGGGFNPIADDYSWLQGVRYGFKGRLFVDIFGDKPTSASAPARGSPGEVKLVSESWLGREPTEAECKKELGDKRRNGRQLDAPDNGC